MENETLIYGLSLIVIIVLLVLILKKKSEPYKAGVRRSNQRECVDCDDNTPCPESKDPNGYYICNSGCCETIFAEKKSKEKFGFNSNWTEKDLEYFNRNIQPCFSFVPENYDPFVSGMMLARLETLLTREVPTDPLVRQFCYDSIDHGCVKRPDSWPIWYSSE